MRKGKRILVIILLLLTAGALVFTLVLKWPLPPTTGQATLTWSLEEDELPAYGFKIYYGTAPRNDDCPPGGYAQNIDVGPSYEYTVKNLLAGKTYYFSVTAYSKSGEESCFIDRELKKTITVTYWERLKNLFAKI